jgi:hypothetical protein
MREGDVGGVTQPVELLVDEDLASRSVVAALQSAGMEQRGEHAPPVGHDGVRLPHCCACPAKKDVS